MKKIISMVIVAALTTSAFAQPNKPVFKNAIDSFSYALGYNVAHSVKDQGVSEINEDLIKQAFADVFAGNSAFTQEQAITILQGYMQSMAEKKLSAEKSKAAAFLEANKKRKGVTTLPSGLQYEVLTAGDPNGIKPKATDTVRVDYVGTLIDGTEFDSSIKRGEPATFPLNGVIRGWTEILQHMPKGSKWKVYIPSELGYGDRGTGGHIPGGATLVFEITLHDVMPAK